MVVFQYGSAVLFNVEDHEIDFFLNIARKHASGLLPEMRKDGNFFLRISILYSYLEWNITCRIYGASNLTLLPHFLLCFSSEFSLTRGSLGDWVSDCLGEVINFLIFGFWSLHPLLGHVFKMCRDGWRLGQLVVLVRENHSNCRSEALKLIKFNWVGLIIWDPSSTNRKNHHIMLVIILQKDFEREISIQDLEFSMLGIILCWLSIYVKECCECCTKALEYLNVCYIGILLFFLVVF